MNETKPETELETTPPNGIKGTASPADWWTPANVLMVIVPVILALTVSWLALVWLGRQRAKNLKKPIQKRDPWQDLGSAIAALPALQDGPDYDQNAWSQLASDVSITARAVYGTATGAPCEDWTTDEFAKRSSSAPFVDGILPQEVLELLRETDLVRFAGRPPQSGMAARWQEQVRSWYAIQSARMTSHTQSTSVVSSESSGVGPGKNDVEVTRVFD